MNEHQWHSARTCSPAVGGAHIGTIGAAGLWAVVGMVGCLLSPGVLGSSDGQAQLELATIGHSGKTISSPHTRASQS